MRDFLMVAFGGLIGSSARYGVGLGVGKIGGQLHWPLATLIVNVVGCLAIGFFAAAVKRWQWSDTSIDLAVRVGLLGGFTTFSAFGLEVFQLWQADRVAAALSVVLMNVITALVAVFLGHWLFEYWMTSR